VPMKLWFRSSRLFLVQAQELDGARLVNLSRHSAASIRGPVTELKSTGEHAPRTRTDPF